jgi:hypothetical protein
MLQICHEELFSIVKCGLFQINLTSLNTMIIKRLTKCKNKLIELAPQLYTRM